MVYANLVLTGDRNTCVLQAQGATTDVLLSVGFCSSKQVLIEGWKNAVCLLSENCSISRKGIGLFRCILRQSEWSSLCSNDFWWRR